MLMIRPEVPGEAAAIHYVNALTPKGYAALMDLRNVALMETHMYYNLL